VCILQEVLIYKKISLLKENLSGAEKLHTRTHTELQTSNLMVKIRLE